MIDVEHAMTYRQTAMDGLGSITEMEAEPTLYQRKEPRAKATISSLQQQKQQRLATKKQQQHQMSQCANSAPPTVYQQQQQSRLQHYHAQSPVYVMKPDFALDEFDQLDILGKTYKNCS
jgi:protein kinase X